MHFRKLKYCLIPLLLISGTKSHAQSAGFKKLISEIETLGLQFESVNPFEERVRLKDFGLTYSQMKGIDPKEFSKGKDSVYTETMRGYLQEKLLQKIDMVVNQKDFRKYVKPEWGNISIKHSTDKKLYNITFFENTGGSHKSNVSMLYYFPEGKKPIRFETEDHDGYNYIYQIKSTTGTKYLMKGTVMACNTCYATYVRLIHFENGSMISDFDYSLLTRQASYDYEADLIMYMEAEKAILVEHYTDDLAPYCKCYEDETPESTAEEPEPPSHRCFCRFNFDGNTFVLANRSDEIVKPTDED